MTTFANLVDIVAVGAHEQGIDVSPKDVGWIVSAYIEGVISSPGEMHPAVVKFLQDIADAAAAVT